MNDKQLFQRQDELLELFNNSTESEKIWFTAEEICQAQGISFSTLEKILMLEDLFIENRKKQITTRVLYHKHTPFLVKLIHALKNKID